jgi:hypothetical protein
MALFDNDDEGGFESQCALSQIFCDYICEDRLRTLIDDTELFALHVNCRSFKANFDALKILVNHFEKPPQLIMVTETWLSPISEHLYQLPGFEFICVSRSIKTGGGVGIYIFIKV